jgi:hypothetical protein
MDGNETNRVTREVGKGNSDSSDTEVRGRKKNYIGLIKNKKINQM